MHFWRRDYFETLKDIAGKARQTPQWSEYADFCDRYEQGLAIASIGQAQGPAYGRAAPTSKFAWLSPR